MTCEGENVFKSVVDVDRTSFLILLHVIKKCGRWRKNFFHFN